MCSVKYFSSPCDGFDADTLSTDIEFAFISTPAQNVKQMYMNDDDGRTLARENELCDMYKQYFEGTVLEIF